MGSGVLTFGGGELREVGAHGSLREAHALGSAGGARAEHEEGVVVVVVVVVVELLLVLPSVRIGTPTTGPGAGCSAIGRGAG